MKDAFDLTIREGDWVLYAKKWSGGIIYRRGKVQEIDKDRGMRVKWDGDSSLSPQAGYVQGHNVVVIPEGRR